MLHLDGLFEDLEEAGGADQFQKILFAALEVGEMMGRDSVGGIELGHVEAGEEVAEFGLLSRETREHMGERCAGFAGVTATARVE